jgi:hypothetical protein
MGKAASKPMSIEDAFNPDKNGVNAAFNRLKGDLTSGFNKMGGEFRNLGNSMNSIFDGIKNFIINNILNPMIAKLREGFSQMTKGIDFIIGKITWVFEKMVHQFAILPRRFNLLGAGLDNMFKGLGYTLKDMFAGIGNGMVDSLLLVEFGFVWLFTNMMCGITLITRLKFCFFYYSLEVFGKLVYLPIRLTLWFISWFVGNMVYQYEKMIWDKLEELDRLVYNYLGFHISHYPRNVRNWCYNCKRLKGSVMSDTASTVAYDFNERLPREMKRSVPRMNKGSRQARAMFALNPPDPKDVRFDNNPKFYDED